MVEIGLHSYNLKVGGEGGFEYANQCITVEKRREISRKGGQTFHISLEEQGRRISAAKKSSPTRLNGSMRVKELYPKGVWFQKTHSEDTKQKLREKAVINQHQQGEKNSQFGSIWITDGTANQKIKKDAVIPEGWRKGRFISKKFSVSLN